MDEKNTKSRHHSEKRFKFGYIKKKSTKINNILNDKLTLMLLSVIISSFF